MHQNSCQSHLPQKYKLRFVATNGLTADGFWCTDGAHKTRNDRHKTNAPYGTKVRTSRCLSEVVSIYLPYASRTSTSGRGDISKTFLSKTWYILYVLCCLCQSCNLVQSTTKVHHPQLFVRTKIYSPYSVSVATSYSRSTQNLTTWSPPPKFTIKCPRPSFFDPLNPSSPAIAGPSKTQPAIVGL